MIRVGITGGIGSGKTTVSKVFSVLGIPVFDADSAAKNIMNEDESVRKKIIETFGESAYEENNLNRKYLADLVFNDAQKLAQLNAITHPVTIAAAEEWMKKQTSPYAIKEAALIFESNAAAGLDYVIGVYAPQELRIERAMYRNNISLKEVMERMNKQIDEEIKMKLCDFIIVNDEKEMIVPQVVKLHKKILQLKSR